MSDEMFEPHGALPPMKRRKPRIPKPHEACEYCGAMIQGNGMSLHRQSNTCMAVQARKNIPKDWLMMTYEIRSDLYAITENWTDFKNYNSRLIRDFLYSYSRPGWGRSGRRNYQTYVHPMLAAILLSKGLSKDEKLVSLYRDPDSPEFRAAYATAELTR